jgi:3-oxoadipate enol-lactonase
MMDTSAGPIHGFDPSLMDAAAEVAFSQGKSALKELLDAAQVLETPAYKRVLAERPGYQAFVDKKWADSSAVMWGALAIALGHQSDDLDAMATSLRCPLLILVGAEDTAFVSSANAMKTAIPAAELVVIPEAGHSPQFENPDVWIEALTKFLARV